MTSEKPQKPGVQPNKDQETMSLLDGAFDTVKEQNPFSWQPSETGTNKSVVDHKVADSEKPASLPENHGIAPVEHASEEKQHPSAEEVHKKMEELSTRYSELLREHTVSLEKTVQDAVASAKAEGATQDQSAALVKLVEDVQQDVRSGGEVAQRMAEQQAALQASVEALAKEQQEALATLPQQGTQDAAAMQKSLQENFDHGLQTLLAEQKAAFAEVFTKAFNEHAQNMGVDNDAVMSLVQKTQSALENQFARTEKVLAEEQKAFLAELTEKQNSQMEKLSQHVDAMAAATQEQQKSLTKELQSVITEAAKTLAEQQEKDHGALQEALKIVEAQAQINGDEAAKVAVLIQEAKGALADTVGKTDAMVGRYEQELSEVLQNLQEHWEQKAVAVTKGAASLTQATQEAKDLLQSELPKVTEVVQSALAEQRAVNVAAVEKAMAEKAKELGVQQDVVKEAIGGLQTTLEQKLGDQDAAATKQQKHILASLQDGFDRHMGALQKMLDQQAEVQRAQLEAQVAKVQAQLAAMEGRLQESQGATKELVERFLRDHHDTSMAAIEGLVSTVEASTQNADVKVILEAIKGLSVSQQAEVAAEDNVGAAENEKRIDDLAQELFGVEAEAVVEDVINTVIPDYVGQLESRLVNYASDQRRVDALKNKVLEGLKMLFEEEMPGADHAKAEDLFALMIDKYFNDKV